MSTPPAVALPRVVGHRGAAAAAPENTLVGIRAAADQGATWVEFDVMLTGDGVPVLHHDETLRRTAGRDAPMAATPLSVVRTLDAGAWFDRSFAGERIPTLEETLALLVTLGLHANVEIKPTRGAEVATAAAAMETIARCWPAHLPPLLISSFKRASLTEALRQAPQVPRGLLVQRLPRDWLKAARALQCSTIHGEGRWLSQHAVRAIKEQDFGLAAYTVNRPASAQRLIARGVDCIITDVPGAIAKAIDSD